MTRRTPLRRSVGTVWPHAVALAIEARDEGRCIGPLVGMPGDCLGRPQKDHVRASGGIGMKSPSTVENGALLCIRHHEMKTNSSLKWRPPILAYIARKARG